MRDLTLCFVLLVALSPGERPGVLLTHTNFSVSEEDYALTSHSCKVGAKNKYLHIKLRSYIEMPGVYLATYVIALNSSIGNYMILTISAA